MSELYRVGVSQYRVVENGTLKIFGLGSCVALAVYDPIARLGGLAHILLPGPPDGSVAGDCKYADRVVEKLLAAMMEAGAGAKRIEAVVVGGANMFSCSAEGDDGLPVRPSVGRRNVEAVCARLQLAGVGVRGMDVGGKKGRTVTFDPADGKVTVTNYKGERKVL